MSTAQSWTEKVAPLPQNTGMQNYAQHHSQTTAHARTFSDPMGPHHITGQPIVNVHGSMPVHQQNEQMSPRNSVSNVTESVLTKRIAQYFHRRDVYDLPFLPQRRSSCPGTPRITGHDTSDHYHRLSMSEAQADPEISENRHSQYFSPQKKTTADETKFPATDTEERYFISKEQQKKWEAKQQQLSKQNDDLTRVDSEKSVSTLNENWNFRHTTSYWISITFMFGAFVFTTGTAFWYLELNHIDELALVGVPYWIGAISFLIGCYAGFFEVINAHGAKGVTMWIRLGKNATFNDSFWAATLFLIGAILYVVYCTCVVFECENVALTEKWPGVIGGICFFIGGCFELKLNTFWRFRPYKLGWWVAYLNGLGGVGFLIAGFGLFVGNGDSDVWVKWPYLIGSFAYLIGSFASLLMWKLEQFGLVLLPSLNLWDIEKRRNTVQIAQLVFLWLYTLVMGVTVSGMTWAVKCPKMDDLGFYGYITYFVFAFLLPLGILILGSVMHRVPETPPYSYLMWLLRALMTWFTLNLFLQCFHIRSTFC